MTAATDLEQEIAGICGCASEFELQERVRAIVHALHLENYIFLVLETGSSGREHYRYFIGCAPAWCQLYNARKWFSCDPILEHAKHHTEILFGSQVQLQSEGQRQLMAAAAQYGFRSGAAVPVHSPGRIGVLYLGSSLLPEEVEPQLARYRLALRGLAFELFEWWQAKRRAEILATLALDEEDLALLRHETKGFGTTEIATLLQLSPSRINKRFLRINRALEVSNRREAAQKAIALGLLDR